MHDALCIEVLHGFVDRAVQVFSVGKGLMRQVMRLEIMPDDLNVVEFRSILGQPLDGEPVSAGSQRSKRELAGVDRTIVLDDDHRLGGLAGLGTVKPIELLERWATKSLLRLVGLV